MDVDGEADALKAVDYSLYESLWSLQRFFVDPNQQFVGGVIDVTHCATPFVCWCDDPVS